MPASPPSGSSLTVLGGPLKGQCLIVDEAADEILVGSDPDCGFCLDLPGVSPIHARIWLEVDGVTVFDTRSPHGVYVNDDRVAGQAPLRDGDILWLGPPGEAESVMIQCRLAAPAPLEVAADEFLFEEPSTLAAPLEEAALGDEFAVSEPGPDDALGADPAMEVAEASLVEPMVEEVEPVVEEMAEEVLEPAEEIATVDADAFFVESAAAAERVEPKADAVASDEMFFVDSAPSVAPPPEPDASSFPLDEGGWPELITADEVAVADAAEATPNVTMSSAAPIEVEPEPAPVSAPLVVKAAPASVTAAAGQPAENARASLAAPASPPVAPGPAATARPAPRVGSEPTRVRTDSSGAGPRPAVRRSGPSRRLMTLAGAGVLALLALGGGAYVLRQRLSAPQLQTISPQRVAVGAALTLSGTHFAATPGGNIVLFGDKPGTVREATSTRLIVEVPDLPTASRGNAAYPVIVRVHERDSTPASVSVYRAPRIHGLSPDVAMPGEEVSLAGTGWSQGVAVRFGSLPAEVLEVNPTLIRVRVPAIEGPPGTSAPVVVTMSGDASNAAPFLVGRLPLIKGIDPASAAPGDVVTLSGRGFHWKAPDNTLRIGGVRALVLSVTASELKAVVPWVPAAGGAVPVELRVPESPNSGEATLTVAAPDAVDFRFAAEPLDDAPGHDHAALATAFGPAFVLAASGGHTAAERALEAQRRLNDAAAPLKATRDLNFEVRNLNASPTIGLAGRPEPILEVAEEDAAAYAEDWTKLGPRKGPVTVARLALWWEAVARDLVLLFIRGERPHFAAGLAPEGRVLADVFDAARRTGRFGVPREVLASAKPTTMAAFRVVGLRVPAQVTGPAAEGSQAAGRPPLRLEGDWAGSELVAASRKYVSVRFKGRGGSLAYEGGISISVPLETLDQPQKGSVRFSVPYRGGSRYYLGKWDGEKLAGTVSSNANGSDTVGTFELSPR